MLCGGDCLLPAAVRDDLDIEDEMELLDEHDDEDYSNSSSCSRDYSEKESVASVSKTTASPYVASDRPSERGRPEEVVNLVYPLDDKDERYSEVRRDLPRQESEMSDGQKNKAFLAKFRSDNSNNNSGRTSGSRSMININSTSSTGNFPVFSYLFNRYDHYDDDPLSVEPTVIQVFPPPAYFDVHAIPHVPTQIDTACDEDWLPSPPSFIYA